MDAKLKEVLSNIAITESVDVGQFQLFGLRWSADPACDYITLDEGLTHGTVKVTEVNTAGSVPDLVVVNDSDMALFVLAGEQLVGAKQNRVLNTSLIVAPRTSLKVPVSCVEAGRWGYARPDFKSTGTSSHSRLRREMMKQVSASYRSSGQARANQGQVWAEVSDKLAFMKSPSASAALEQAFEDHRARLEEFVARARVSGDCHGVLFACNGQVMGLDLFDQPATLAKLLPKLVRSYAIDALENGETRTVPEDEVAAWLSRTPALEVERFKSPGLGDDLRLHAEEICGAGLVVEPGPVHLSLFRDDGSARRRPPVPTLPIDPDQLGASPASAEPVPAVPTGLTVFPTSGDALRRLAAGLSALRGDLGGSARPSLALLDAISGRVLRPRRERELVARVVALAPASQRRMIVTDVRLADRWFSHWHAEAGTAVVSLADWEALCPVPAEAFLALQCLLCDLSRDDRLDARALFHEETRGCLFDLCAYKPDIEHKLRQGSLCRDCHAALERRGVDVTSVHQALARVRELAAQR